MGMGEEAACHFRHSPTKKNIQTLIYIAILLLKIFLLLEAIEEIF